MSKRTGRSSAGRPPQDTRSASALSRRRRWWLAALAAGIGVAVVLVGVLALRSGSDDADQAGTDEQQIVEVGAVAPDGQFTTIDDQSGSVAELQGEPVLLWLIATWCSTCQAGTQALANGGIDRLEQAGATVVELKMHDNLNGPDEDMAEFVEAYAPAQRDNPAWAFGTASEQLTNTYNPQGYLDIYYLLDAQGKVQFVNTAPAGTFSEILNQIQALESTPDSGGNGADEPAIEGMRTFEDLSREHVSDSVDYPQTPPVGGEHAEVWQNCDGAVYDQPLRDERAVHSLEHGAVWLTYHPELPEQQIARLRELVDGQPYRMLSPYPDQPEPVTATAWGRQLALDSATDERLPRFLEAYTQGPHTPEPGAGCDGGSDTP